MELTQAICLIFYYEFSIPDLDILIFIRHYYTGETSMATTCSAKIFDSFTFDLCPVIAF